MPRKPVHRLSKTESRAAVWALIRSLGTFAARDIITQTRLGTATVRNYLTGLTRAGYLEHTMDPPVPGRWPSGRYRLIKDIGVDHPRVNADGTPVTQGLGREQLWRTMRILKEFTTRELAIAAGTETVAISESDAKSYCHYLHLAGYLICTQKHNSGRPGMARYRLVTAMYTGPKPPMIQSTRQLYDPNLQKVVWAAITKGGDDDA